MANRGLGPRHPGRLARIQVQVSPGPRARDLGSLGPGKLSRQRPQLETREIPEQRSRDQYHGLGPGSESDSDAAVIRQARAAQAASLCQAGAIHNSSLLSRSAARVEQDDLFELSQRLVGAGRHWPEATTRAVSESSYY